MRTRLLASAGVVLLALGPGCAYRIHVRGELQPETPRMERGATVCVEVAPGGGTDERAEDTARKIRTLLVDGGYRVVPQEDAAYYLFFRYEVKGLLEKPVLMPVAGPRSGLETVRAEAPFVHTLSLSLVEGDSYRDAGPAQVVWSGGSALSNTQVSSRKVLDLLLVAAFRHFPENTGRTVEVRLSMEHPEAKRLRSG